MLSFTKCRTCGEEIPPRSKECPHCHTKWPVVRAEVIIGWVIMLCLIAFVLLPGSDEPTAAEQTETVEQGECSLDIECWANFNFEKAKLACTPLIESQTPFSFRWTDGNFSQRFDKAVWLDSASGQMTYLGDEMEIQNEYGAWLQVVYECDYSAFSNRAMAARLGFGSLK